MGKLQGISVILYEKVQDGVDAFHVPVFVERPVEVHDVLVGLPNSEDIVNTLDLTGRRLTYVLGIPKGDTHDWTDCTIEFYGKKFRSFGFPEEGIEANIPLRWHKKVMVEFYE